MKTPKSSYYMNELGEIRMTLQNSTELCELKSSHFCILANVHTAVRSKFCIILCGFMQQNRNSPNKTF